MGESTLQTVLADPNALTILVLGVMGMFAWLGILVVKSAGAWIKEQRNGPLHELLKLFGTTVNGLEKEVEGQKEALDKHGALLKTQLELQQEVIKLQRDNLEQQKALLGLLKELQAGSQQQRTMEGELMALVDKVHQSTEGVSAAVQEHESKALERWAAIDKATKETAGALAVLPGALQGINKAVVDGGATIAEKLIELEGRISQAIMGRDAESSGQVLKAIDELKNLIVDRLKPSEPEQTAISEPNN